MPKLITAETGEDIALSCFPPEGNPRPTIRWRRRGAGGQLIPQRIFPESSLLDKETNFLNGHTARAPTAAAEEEEHGSPLADTSAQCLSVRTDL